MSDLQVYTIYIKAPKDTVWKALTTSEYTSRWGYGGDIDVDLTPGGHYRNLTTPDMRAMGLGDTAVEGEVLSIDEGNRLELSWHPTWHVDMAPTVVTWELTEYPSGLTKVVLTHDLSAAPGTGAEFAGGHDPDQGGGGWPWVISDLKTLLESGNPMQA
ncbi:MAG: SRPBCC domain-containing protein [Propionibacteriaceae bacterium]|nr:SRPBCC domain-containing protein [Propionibacteriaceae bacterium]